jgi:hypothetical protein
VPRTCSTTAQDVPTALEAFTGRKNAPKNTPGRRMTTPYRAARVRFWGRSPHACCTATAGEHWRRDEIARDGPEEGPAPRCRRRSTDGESNGSCCQPHPAGPRHDSSRTSALQHGGRSCTPCEPTWLTSRSGRPESSSAMARTPGRRVQRPGSIRTGRRPKAAKG